MRRLLVTALAAVTFAAPVPDAVAADGTSGFAGHIESKVDRVKRELRQGTRIAKRAAANRHAAKPAVAIPPQLQAIAQCESGGNPRAVSADGTYRGLFQFDSGTWASVGGSGDPAAAPASEQYRRAAILYARAGSSPWPVCG